MADSERKELRLRIPTAKIQILRQGIGTRAMGFREAGRSYNNLCGALRVSMIDASRMTVVDIASTLSGNDA